MARIDTLSNFLTDVATAIKNKKGDTTPILASNFDTEITNLPSGGSETPEVGFIIDEYDGEGYVTKVTVVGMTSLPDGVFSNYSSTVGSFLTKKLQEVILPNEMTTLGATCFRNATNLININLENITEIGQNCFTVCSLLQLTELPKNLTTIGASAFFNCPNVTIKTIPVGVTRIETSAFARNTSITQMSMPNVEYIYGDTVNSAFTNCTNLKAYWIGSTIATNGLGRYSLSTYDTYVNNHNLKYIYIDLPRATVSNFTGYSYKFVNSNSSTVTIICNDDEGFITKEEFDAIDWSTQ